MPNHKKGLLMLTSCHYDFPTAYCYAFIASAFVYKFQFTDVDFGFAHVAGVACFKRYGGGVAVFDFAYFD